MKFKELEKLVTDHLMESTGIKQHLANLDSKMNWVMGLIACVFIALLSNYLRH